MTANSWLNGEPATQIDVGDRGLQYGDGVFETMAVRAGRIALLDMHLQRLVEGCDRLGIIAPAAALIRDELTVAASGQQHAILKLIVTRGSGGRGYRPASDITPARILTRHPWPMYPQRWWQDGVRVRMCHTVLGSNPQLAGIKHLNRLEQVLARSEWSDADDIQEGFMTAADGSVIEGTMTNVFVRRADETWVTPDLCACGVAGVMRRYILERAEASGLAVRVGTLGLRELQAAVEIFVCNSIIGVWPVVQLDTWRYEIGDTTRRVQQWVEET